MCSQTTPLRVAIADPVSSASLLAAAARCRVDELVELRTVDASAEFYSRGYRPELFDRVVEHGGDLDATLDALRDVDHVLIGADSSVPLVERINWRRGQLGNDPAWLDARSNKRDMARAFAGAGIVTARQEFLVEVDGAVDFARGRYPVVVKPAASGGTQGVFLARDEAELRRRFVEVAEGESLYRRENGGALVMDYVPVDAADELVVDAVSLDGRHVVTDTWIYEKAPMHGTPAMYRVMRTVDMREVLPEIALAKRMLDAVGHRQGASHSELWRLRDRASRERFGARNLPVEIGFRLPGVIPTLSALAFGRDQVELTLDSVLSPDRFATNAPWVVSMRRHAAVVFLAAEATGRLRRDLDVARIEGLPSYHSSSFKASRAGDAVVRTIDLGTLIGWVGLIHDDRDALERDIETLWAIEAEANDVVDG